MEQTSSAREQVEVLADVYVIRTVLQRLSCNGVQVSDEIHDLFEGIEGRATDTLLDSLFGREDMELNVEAAFDQEIKDINTQIVQQRQDEEEAFARGFDEAHAESEMDL